MSQNYKFVQVKGHVEIYDESGKFVFSADTVKEAEQDLELLCA